MVWFLLQCYQNVSLTVKHYFGTTINWGYLKNKIKNINELSK